MKYAQRAVATVLFLTCMVSPATADEDAIVSEIQAFFATSDVDVRAKTVERIQSDPAYDRSKVRDFLHRATPFKPLRSGPRMLRVPIGTDKPRTVRLRIPKNYDPSKPWPIILAYHGSGVAAVQFIRSLERMLGSRIDEFVIAAPHDYRNTIVDLPKRLPPEHQAVLLSVKKTIHVDSDRIFVMGYSLGGYTSWTLAAVRAQEFAGAVAMAAPFSVPADGDLWRAFFPNFQHVPILNVWGGRDSLNVPTFGGRRSTDTISALCDQFQEIVTREKLGVVTHRIPGVGHGGATPPKRLLDDLLTNRRMRYPASVDHTFRYLHQAHAYWIEGHSWAGPVWDAEFHQSIVDRLNALPDGADSKPVMDDVIRRMGRLRANVSGQTLSVIRRNVDEVTVWIGDDMIDWNAPIKLEIDGTERFAGKIVPNLFVCLTEAARTLDFERLRWAGLRVKGEAPAKRVTGRTTSAKAFP